MDIWALKIRDCLFLVEIAILILLGSTDKYGSSGLALDNRYLEAFFVVVQHNILNPPSARTMPRRLVDPRPGHQIYQDEMILKRHGFPVWFGDPFGKAEIEIGDIGYMKSAPSSTLYLTNSIAFQRRIVCACHEVQLQFQRIDNQPG